MFDFRLINTPDGNQIIDTTLKTPYSSLTPLQMVEYMERMERKQKREEERKQKFTYKFMRKVACMCGLVLQNVYFMVEIKQNREVLSGWKIKFYPLLLLEKMEVDAQ